MSNHLQRAIHPEGRPHGHLLRVGPSSFLQLRNGAQMGGICAPRSPCPSLRPVRITINHLARRRACCRAERRARKGCERRPLQHTVAPRRLCAAPPPSSPALRVCHTNFRCSWAAREQPESSQRAASERGRHSLGAPHWRLLIWALTWRAWRSRRAW